MSEIGVMQGRPHKDDESGGGDGPDAAVTLPVVVTLLALVAVGVGLLSQKKWGEVHESSPAMRQARLEGAVDVLLIVVDTERADHTSVHGHPMDTTPFLKELADHGIRFENAFAPGPWTVPSMYSLFTGLYPSEHGMVKGQAPQGAVEDQGVLPEEAETLPEVLSQNGYETFGVCTNMHLAPRYGFDQGFHRFVGEDFAFMPFPERVVEALADEVRASGKYFMWLHYFDPHHPYHTQRPWFDGYNQSPVKSYPQFNRQCVERVYRHSQMMGIDDDLTADDLVALQKLGLAIGARPFALLGRMRREGIAVDDTWKEFLDAAYSSEIRMVDESIRRVSEVLGVDDETIVIVTSDHGEEFYDHGTLGHRVNDSLYQELIHVPLVIRLPHDELAGTVVHEPVSLVDLYPTLLELAQIPCPSGLSGRSLVPLMHGRPWEKKPIYSEVDSVAGRSLCLVEYPFKYIHSLTTGSGELYDIAADPHEREDLARDDETLANHMREKLLEWNKKTKSRWEPLPPPVLSPAQIFQLEMLGYL